MNPAVEALLQELQNQATTAQRRLEIGQALEKLGDPRPGVGIKDGVPDIQWLPVTPGGTVTVQRAWHPETPDEEYRVLSRQEINVAPFYIAKYLVTYAQYQAFVDADDGFDNSAWWQGMPQAYQRQPLAEQGIQSFNDRAIASWFHESMAVKPDGRAINFENRPSGGVIPDPSHQWLDQAYPDCPRV